MAKPRKKRPLFDRSTRRILLFAVGLALLVATLRVVIPRGDAPPQDLAVLVPGRGEPTMRILLGQLQRARIPTANAGGLSDAKGRRHRLDHELIARDGALWSGSEAVSLPARLDPGPGALSWGGRRYAGSLVFHRDGERLLVVNHVPLETYLEGVVLEEMGHRAPLQALKAQAVVSRSYALARHRPDRNPRWDLRSDQSAQVYRGIPTMQARARSAVQETRGVVLAYRGRILEGLYSSTCGGWSRPASEAFGARSPEPLEQKVACEFCRHSPTWRWTHRRRLQELRSRLGLPSGPVAVDRLQSLPSGRLSKAVFRTGRGLVEVSARKLRRAMGARVRSAWITAARIEGAELVVEGRGFGHGVGLCQYGARGQALAGRNWSAIIEHYYPGAGLALGWSPKPGA